MVTHSFNPLSYVKSYILCLKGKPDPYIAQLPHHNSIFIDFSLKRSLFNYLLISALQIRLRIDMYGAL